jgi:hypothetical protein
MKLYTIGHWSGNSHSNYIHNQIDTIEHEKRKTNFEHHKKKRG